MPGRQQANHARMHRTRDGRMANVTSSILNCRIAGRQHVLSDGPAGHIMETSYCMSWHGWMAGRLANVGRRLFIIIHYGLTLQAAYKWYIAENAYNTVIETV